MADSITNLIGTLVAVLSTNWSHTTYEPIHCPVCKRGTHIIHYYAVDHYRIGTDVVITNVVDHPSVHKVTIVQSAPRANSGVPPMPLTRVLPVPTLTIRRSSTNGLPHDGSPLTVP